MKKDDFEELVASIKEAVSIHKGEIKAPVELDVPNPKKIREKLKLSQPEFAEFVGVRVSTLRNWEQGRRRVPTIAKNFFRIAERHPNIVLELAK